MTKEVSDIMDWGTEDKPIRERKILSIVPAQAGWRCEYLDKNKHSEHKYIACWALCLEQDRDGKTCQLAIPMVPGENGYLCFGDKEEEVAWISSPDFRRENGYDD
jgi:hypothetical protein